MKRLNKVLLVIPLLSGLSAACAQLPAPEVISGMTYTNSRDAKVPWSIHVVRVARSPAGFEIHTAHADGRALGLSTLTEQIQRMGSALGRPVAAVNGDYYQRDRTYAGDPRGLQVIEGEVISGPNGGACFWIDVLGQPHADNVQSRFEIIWPHGATNAFGLNEDRRADGLVLYTPAIGSSTHTEGGRELVLEKGEGPWLPLRMGRVLKARVREIRESGNTPVGSNTLVLSLGPTFAKKFPRIEPGAQLLLSTGSLPDLRGAKTAIGGGPVLVREGRRLKTPKSDDESYVLSSRMERHPRTAIGWNNDEFLLVEVDGRQRNLSVGMTLDELSAYLVTLGCEGAMNLDGGGSATLWCNGEIRNSPCDGDERPIANSLIVVRKPAPSEKSSPRPEESDR